MSNVSVNISEQFRMLVLDLRFTYVTTSKLTLCMIAMIAQLISIIAYAITISGNINLKTQYNSF